MKNLIDDDIIQLKLNILEMRFSKKIVKDEYYLSYSGGRDSHFLYWFIKEYLKDNQIKIVGCNTKIEHNEILQRILKNSDEIVTPQINLEEIKERYGIPCFSKMQDDFINRYQKGSRAVSTMEKFYGSDRGKFSLNKTAIKMTLDGTLHRVSPLCCDFTKKLPLHIYEHETNKNPIMGIRGSESVRRNAKYKTCLGVNKKFSPLFDFTDDIIQAIESKYNIPIPKIYDIISRTGCYGCPYGSHKGDTQKELEIITPNQKKYITGIFKQSYDVLKIKY